MAPAPHISTYYHLALLWHQVFPVMTMQCQCELQKPLQWPRSMQRLETGARDVTKCSVKTCSTLQHAAGPKVSPRGSAAGSRGPIACKQRNKKWPREREPGGEHSALRACALCVDILVRSNAFRPKRYKSYTFLCRDSVFISHKMFLPRRKSWWQRMMDELSGNCTIIATVSRINASFTQKASGLPSHDGMHRATLL